MAISDPTMAVPTPTGALQGVAAFSWDGSQWQPAGAAGPSVATPTGVLRGIAPFTWDGSAWLPSGRAQYDVATSSGVLEGAAVYTWSGSAWTPAGGTATPATPTGALRGVAAFNWDGSAWQPTAQVGPSVATPYGVLQGVAMFNWSGTAWAAVGAPSLDLSFMSPGTLDPRITFTRASTATYFDNTGTLQTATTNTPRWDYNPSTHALNGLLIEEARTNIMLNSSNFGIAPWSVTAATVAGSAGTAPDGTNSLTLLSETSTTAGHYLAAGVLTVASTQYSLSIFVKAAGVRYLHTVLDDGVVTGGYATFDLQTGTVSQIMTAIGASVLGVALIQLISNGIYRCTIVTSIGTGVNARILFMCSNTGTPSAYPSYAGNAANGLLIWGTQLEAGASPTSYIPTTAASVTRAADNASMPTAAWFNAGVGTLATEFIMRTVPATQNTEFIGVGTNSAILVRGFVPGTLANATLYMFNGGGALLAVSTANNVTLGTTSKSALTYNTTSLLGTIALNGGAVASGTASGAFGAFTTVFIGGSGITRGLPLNGTLSRIRYWPRALSNAELQQVTT